MAGTVIAQRKPKDGYFRTSDGVRIHYITQGKGTPVILIHGYMANAQNNWFINGIAAALARNHRVVAIDCRNHGKSDKPEPMARGRAGDVIEMMDHLKIRKAHFHGYSMGGNIVRQLMALIPDRFITAAFGGSGVQEVDPEMKAKAPTDKERRDPLDEEAMAKLLAMRAADLGMTIEELQKQRAALSTAVAAGSLDEEGLQVDLTKITFPVLAINGEFDHPLAKTVRMHRELRNFTNVVLAGKSHVTAIGAGYMPQEYLGNLVKFINANDPKK